MKRSVYLIPLVIFLVLSAYFAKGLTLDPRALPSMLDGQPMPAFELAPIAGRARGFSSEDLKGQVTLVNVFGSWCIACQVEHPFLMELKASGEVPIFGIDWRERDTLAGPRWLRRYGDPYTRVGDDPKSRATIALGVTGAPESFLVDRAGIVRYKHVGPITREDWEQILWPLIEKLRRS